MAFLLAWMLWLQELLPPYPRKALKPKASGSFASWAFCRKLGAGSSPARGDGLEGLLTSATKAAVLPSHALL